MGPFIPLLLLLLLLLLLPSPALSSKPVVIDYTCDAVQGPLACTAALQACLASPRPWLAGMGGATPAQYACSTCWAEAYRCYRDCSSRFPPTFAADCAAFCPPSASDACNPRSDWAFPGNTAPAPK